MTFGFADLGQLGNGKIEEKSYQWPQLIASLNHAKIKQIACGLDHNLALAEDGKVYGWGSAMFGQLGLGLSENPVIAEPQEIKNLPPFVRIFAGGDHSGGVDGMCGDFAQASILAKI